MPVLHPIASTLDTLGTQFTRRETGHCPAHNRETDDHRIMTVFDATWARLAFHTRGGRGSARDRGGHVRGLCVHTKSVHAILDGLKQPFEFGRDYAIESNFVTHE
jgi:hypothetical protein